MNLRRQTKILAQSPKQRIRTAAPWEYGFSKFLGRRLTAAELAVISPIEKARRTSHSKPFLVIDPPGHDSSPMLMQYIRYCLSLGEESYAILVHPTGEKPPKEKRVYRYSSYCPEASRGMSADFMLMRNVERYKTASPFYGDKSYNNRWSRLYCALNPQLARNGVLIIHTVMPSGRKLKKYSYWLSKLTYVFHIRAEALPKSILRPPVLSVAVPVVIELDDYHPESPPESPCDEALRGAPPPG